MTQLVSTDHFSQPDSLSHSNPLLKLLQLVERMPLAAEREYYLADSIQYMIPFDYLELSESAAGHIPVECQDSKGDFQQQNILDFHTADTWLARGWVHRENWACPFLRVSYRGDRDSKLSQATHHQLGEGILLWIKVGERTTDQPLWVPYNPLSARYEVELWGHPIMVSDLAGELDIKGQGALQRGELLIRSDLLCGDLTNFDPQNHVNDQWLLETAPDHAMHPLHPLHIELAWAESQGRIWDSQEGANYHYTFSMLQRGLNAYQAKGTSRNPHGGTGVLEYRNLFSNYGRYRQTRELGRTIAPWSFNAAGLKSAASRGESFFAVDYMDLSILKPGCSIGLHRHRDNQEAFFMVNGKGLMVIGDWYKQPDRERCFEVRTLKHNHLTLLKNGQLHGLMNITDADITLFTLGGYD
jgi:hypothetical protein